MNAAIHRISKAKQALESGLSGDQPKYRYIFESLRESILSGEFQEGRRLPSETELVRRFGVSRMTIVKAVKELQQLGLVTRRVGSGTYAAHRQALEHQLFGLLIPELGQTEIFEPVCQGMAAFPAATQHSLLWSSGVGESRDKESAALELCERYVGQHVSGVFFAPLELTPARDKINRRIIERLASAGIPVVLLDRCYAPYPRRSPYDLVGIDNRRTAYLATEHLFCAGARRVAFLGRPHSASTVEARIAGWREALFARGQGMDGGLVLRADPDDTDIVRRFLDRHHPDAFLCANDNTATALMQTLLAMGRRVPEEIRMMGIDDVKYAALLPVPLTTQHQPCVEIGAMAMATMLDRVAHPELPVRDVLLDCRLVVRRSCGASENRTMEENA